MSVEENKKIALKFVEYLGQGRVAELPLDPEFSGWSGTSGDVEQKEYLTRIKLIPKMFSEPLLFTIDGVTAEGDRVAVQCRSKGKLITGADYENNYHMLCVFRNGKLFKTYEYMNTKTAFDLLMPVLKSLRN